MLFRSPAQPTLSHTVLAGPGVGDHPGAAGFDGDDRGTQGAGHFDPTPGVKIELGEDGSLLPDHRAVGQTPLPNQGQGGADRNGGSDDETPVSGS